MLAIKGDWANGNKKELWVQYNDRLDIEIRKLVPTPSNGQTSILIKILPQRKV